MATEYYTLTGTGALRKRGSTGNYRKVGNIREAKIALTQETLELKSTEDTPGTIAEDIISADATLSLLLENQVIDNVALALQATVADIAATTGTEFTYPVAAVGDVVKLAHANITSITVPGKTEGVDFKLVANKSALEILVANATAVTTGCEYDSAAYKAMGMRTASSDEYSFLFWSEKTKRTYEVLRFKLNPGEHNLISDQYGQIPLEGKLLQDETVDASDLPAELKALGKFVRVSRV